MKKEIIRTGLMLLVLSASLSCKKALDKVLSTEIPIKNSSIRFTVGPASKVSAVVLGTRTGESENVLYEGDLEVNIVGEIEKQGFSFENIKSFLLEKGTLELVTPSDYDLSGLKDVKLYFGNRDNPVAKADAVSAGKITFSVVNGELLDRLNRDKLHIILTGSLPSKEVTLKLVTDYLAKLSLIK